MENASKALIIAGAILLSILIISLGIMIYNQAAGVVNNNAMSDVEKTTFNSKFTQYEGTVKGAQVNALLQQIRTSNADENNSERQVTTTFSGTAKTGTTYYVRCNYSTSGTNNGLVNSIDIQTTPFNTDSTGGTTTH